MDSVFDQSGELLPLLIGNGGAEVLNFNQPLADEDYLGYFVTAADYPQPGYVTCATLYGPRTGECLTAAAIELLTRLGRGEPTGAGRLTAQAVSLECRSPSPRPPPMHKRSMRSALETSIFSNSQSPAGEKAPRRTLKGFRG